MPESEPDIGAILEDRERIDGALSRAVREALRRHKLLRNPVTVWRDGKVVWVAPEDIGIDEAPGVTQMQSVDS